MSNTILPSLVIVAFLITACNQGSEVPSKQGSDKKNIILILTDDQGYGDLGFTGNSIIKTPVLDNLAEESVQFTNFYVSPVCSPTRSSLLTGRYSLRTGVYDTWNGGSIMAVEEITVAEILKNNGYRTGIIGKWHLGDNYPFRPIDQGFTNSLVGNLGDMDMNMNFNRVLYTIVRYKC